MMIEHENDLSGLAAVLYADNLIDKVTAKNAVQIAKQQGLSLATYLVKADILSSETILNCCIKNFSLPVFDLKNYDFAWLQHSVLNSELICRYHIIPLMRDKYTLQLGLSDPTDHTAMSALSFHTNLAIRPILISEIELEKFINNYFRPNILYAQLESTLSKMLSVEEPTQDVIQPDNEQDDEPVIEFVDQLLLDAIEKNISDIHIEPHAKHCRIRFRRDGLLYEAATTPLHLYARLIIRLKIMANLNIAEKRLPQDGHIKISSKHQFDIRINTCPTIHGEKIVLRLLNIENVNLDIDSLGFLPEQQQLFLEKISQPQGLILVTGPTGSGKTISLYSALHYLNRIERNISTVEDPVEIELSGINQISINPRIGLDFTHVLRTLLRQDPDTIMIGEIRDKETAAIAIQAAQTGHIVLATLHTNNALETINRLQSIGVDYYQLTSCVSLIIAQRLVRKLCNACKQQHDLLTVRATKLKNMTYHAIGCEHCHQGYHGRIGIFECLAMTEYIVELILNGKTMLQISDYLKQSAWTSLCNAGLEKVKNGTTSYDELLRVLGFIPEVSA